MAQADVPVARVQINLSCKNLINQDLLSKSDPQVHVAQLDERTKQWSFFAKTEVVWDDLNPKFQTAIELNYYFEQRQMLRFVVVDVDSGKGEGRMEDQDFLGQIELPLSRILSSRGQTVDLPLNDRNAPASNRGTIKIFAEEMTDNNQDLGVRLSCHNLDQKDFFGKSDPYYVISRLRDNGEWVVVHKGEVIQNTLNPQWKPILLSIRKLCNGDMERTLLVQVFDWNKVMQHELIGEFRATVNEFLRNPEFPLTNPALKAKKKSYKNSGIFRVSDQRLFEKPTFLQYIRAGLDINLAVAVDFTQSNGDPRTPTSLHYITQNQFNQYQQAIYGVGNILQEYDTDKRFPVFGFGAKFPDGNVSHCFPLNGNPNDPEVSAVDGILAAYFQAINVVSLWGPTNFAPVLSATRSVIEASLRAGEIKYFILLIITDGVITDMDATVRCIVEMSGLPLSIVIVGVGNADFSMMDVLDGDTVPLQSNGRRVERDIVQFVPFNRCNNPQTLAQETLAEIPGQVLSYMMSKNILPNNLQGR